MERRLAAILAVDVVGYSPLMGDDEAGLLARLKALREELIDPEIAYHKRGDIFFPVLAAPDAGCLAGGLTLGPNQKNSSTRKK